MSAPSVTCACDTHTVCGYHSLLDDGWAAHERSLAAGGRGTPKSAAIRAAIKRFEAAVARMDAEQTDDAASDVAPASANLERLTRRTPRAAR